MLANGRDTWCWRDRAGRNKTEPLRRRPKQNTPEMCSNTRTETQRGTASSNAMQCTAKQSKLKQRKGMQSKAKRSKAKQIKAMQSKAKQHYPSVTVTRSRGGYYYSCSAWLKAL